MKIKKFKLVALLLAIVFMVTFVSAELMAYSYSSYGNRYSTNNNSYRYSSGNSYYRSGSNYSSRYGSSYNSGNSGNSNTGDNNGNTNTGDNNTGNSNTGNEGSTDSGSSPSGLLKYGMKNNTIKALQQKLDRLGYTVSATGYYDRRTTLAVMYFQRDNNLPITGKVDSTTLGKINSVYNDKFSGSSPAPAPTPKPEPTPTPQPTPTPTPTEPSNNLRSEAYRMLEMINSERQANGVAPLKMDSSLINVAEKKSQDMIDNNYFSHTSPTYGSPFKMLNDAGINYNTAGENIAGNNSVSGAHRSLMNSSGHRKNILNPKFTKIGIGIKKGGPYGMMFTQIFTG